MLYSLAGMCDGSRRYSFFFFHMSVFRLYIWGLAHEGESGCRHVMKSLLADLDITCTVAGIPSLQEIKGKRDLLR